MERKIESTVKRENIKIFISYEKEKKQQIPCFHFHDLSTLGYLASFEEIRLAFLRDQKKSHFSVNAT